MNTKTIRIAVLLGLALSLSTTAFAGWETEFPKGWNEGFYLATYPDVAKAVHLGWFKTGWQHFVLYGRKEGRVSSDFHPPAFDEAFYLRTYPDVRYAVAAGWFKSGLEHFILYGRFEGRMPVPPPPPPVSDPNNAALQ